VPSGDVTITGIVFVPGANGWPSDAVPVATAVPLTVTVAKASLVVGVTVTEVVALLTIAV